MMKKNSYIIIIVVIAMASFFGFHPIFSLFKDTSAQAFGSAIFGTIFTIVLTMFLLNKQTEVSETSQKNQVVFKEKLALFNKITDILGKCFKDGKISKDERPELQLVLMGLTMLAKDETIVVFNDLLKDLFDEETEPEADITVTPEQRDKLLKFVVACRRELDLDESSEKSAKFQEQKAEQLQENLSPTLAAMGTEKRITFSGWDEFEKSQSADSRKETFIPIAKAVHYLIIETMNKEKIKPEINYGGGTFSFKVPKDNAKTAKRTFARFGLLDAGNKSCYLDFLYKNAEAKMPIGAKNFRPSIKEVISYRFKSIEDFDKWRESIESAVITSYNFLSTQKK